MVVRSGIKLVSWTLIVLLFVIMVTGCKSNSTSIPQISTAPTSSMTFTTIPEVSLTPTPLPATPTAVNQGESPEEIEGKYLQSLMQRNFEQAVSYISDYSLSLEGKTRQDIVSFFEKQDFGGWRMLDYRIEEVENLENGVVLLHVMTKEKNGDSEPQTYDFWVALRKENGHWRINWDLIIDDMLLEVEPQVVNNVSVQPVRVIRYTDKMELILRIQNSNERGCFWGWADTKVATFYFDSQAVDVPFTSPLKIEPQRTYPDAYVVVNGEFKTYPDAVDLVGWRLASKASPNLPDPSSSPWKYHFELHYQSPQG